MSYPNTLQQNRVAEWKNQHLAETCWNMLHTKSVPPWFCTECMKTAAHVINRLFQMNLEVISPFEKVYNLKLAVSHFRVFGCVCYMFIQDHLEASSIRGRFSASLLVMTTNERVGSIMIQTRVDATV